MTPGIDGDLYIKTEAVVINKCTTAVNVGNELIYKCPTAKGSSPLNVIANQPVTVTASYQSTYKFGPFYHCLGFYQLSDGMGPMLYDL